jgi:large subunit ribosomal protein L10
MAKLKSQKNEDLAELTEKLKHAKSAVLTGYSGTTVKDITKFRSTLRKEKVFSKVYKLTLIKKAMKDAGYEGEIADYKQPVILSVSEDEDPTPARVIKSLSKDIKTLVILEGLFEKKLVSKDMVMSLADLPSKDQLRSQFMSVLNGPISAFARVLNAYAEKMSKATTAVASEPSAELTTAPAV